MRRLPRLASSAGCRAKGPSGRCTNVAGVGSVEGMDVAPVGIDPPRPPLFERITPTQWVVVDVVLAGLFMLAALGHLYRGLDLGAHHWSEWVLTPLYVMATLPVAIRRRWP